MTAESARTAERPLVDPEWAWAPYEPDPERPWNLARVGHLYRRAAFGASRSELARALDEGPRRAAERLIRPVADTDSFNRTHDEYEATESGSESLRAWWLRRMIRTPHPLLEKMTLFWHGHFATSNVQVQDVALMGRHVRLLRKHALGDFGALLRDISRDPALLLGLGAQASRRARPDERFPGALLGHFTLGAGHFAEADVQEAARAFTGRFVIRGELRDFPRERDSGVKRVLGEEGSFDSDDVIGILLRRRETGRMIARALYREFVSELDEPRDDLLAPLVAALSRNHDIAELLGTVLRSNLFHSPASYRRKLKSPVEYAVGLLRAFESNVPTVALGTDLAALGQDLYSPPTVEGWEGGRSWVHWWTLVGRSNLALDLLTDEDRYAGKLDPLAPAARHGEEAPEAVARFLLDLLLEGNGADGLLESLLQSCRPVDSPASDAPAEMARKLCHLIVTSPEYQLA